MSGNKLIGLVGTALPGNFGNSQTVSISGHKFEDLNGNGLPDDLNGTTAGAEPGLRDWMILAYGDTNGDGILEPGELINSVDATTAPDGSFTLQLSPGSYVIVEVLPDDWVQSLPIPDPNPKLAPVFADNYDTGTMILAQYGYSITVAAGHNLQGFDFGNRQRPPEGTVTGHKFHDLNGNGLPDDLNGATADAEPGLGGWTILAYADDGDGVLQDAEITDPVVAMTDASGFYSLSLAPGHYILVEAVPPRWEQTLPSPDPLPQIGSVLAAVTATPDGILGTYGYAVLVVNHGVHDGYDFGNLQTDVQISGRKFGDLNLNGLADAGDPGLQGFEIRLYRDTNGDGMLNQTEYDARPIATTTSDANGDYSFQVSPNAGFDKYIVAEVLPDNSWQQTAPADNVLAAGLVTAGEILGSSGYALNVSPVSTNTLDNRDFGNFQAVVDGQAAVNRVGTSHTFVVTFTVRDNSGNDVPLACACVVASLTNGNGAQSEFVSDGNDCNGDGNTGNDAVTDASGVARFTINSFTTGTTTASFDVAAVGGMLSIEGDGRKIWVDAGMGLEPLTGSATVGSHQSVTAIVLVDDGLLPGQVFGGITGDAVDGFGPPNAGTQVSFELRDNSATASFVSGNACATATLGACGIDVVASHVGSTNVHATSTVSVLSVSFLVETDGMGVNSGEAQRTWVSSGGKRPFASTLGGYTTRPSSPPASGSSTGDGSGLRAADSNPEALGTAIPDDNNLANAANTPGITVPNNPIRAQGPWPTRRPSSSGSRGDVVSRADVPPVTEVPPDSNQPITAGAAVPNATTALRAESASSAEPAPVVAPSSSPARPIAATIPRTASARPSIPNLALVEPVPHPANEASGPLMAVAPRNEALRSGPSVAEERERVNWVRFKTVTRPASAIEDSGLVVSPERLDSAQETVRRPLLPARVQATEPESILRTWGRRPSASRTSGREDTRCSEFSSDRNEPIQICRFRVWN